MYILISPAKTMKEERKHLPQRLPILLSKSKQLHQRLIKMTQSEMKDLMKINDKLAKENVERFMHMQFDRKGICALDAYDGVQFKAMKTESMSEEEWQYMDQHLRILSGFYGILRPSDAIYPYRLEMQTKLAIDGAKNLYEFWQDDIANTLLDDELIINLASKEYEKSIRPYRSKESFIDIIFYIATKDKLVTRSTQVKKARGQMVEYMTTQKIKNVEDIKQFSSDGYRYQADLSQENKLVFVKEVEA